jgi:hypothetical protein
LLYCNSYPSAGLICRTAAIRLAQNAASIVPSDAAQVQMTHTLTCQFVTSYQKLNSSSAFIEIQLRSFVQKNSPASLRLVKIGTVQNKNKNKNNTGLLHQNHELNLVPFCTFFVRVIKNFVQDMSRRMYAVTFRDSWCNARHALLKDADKFLRVFSHFLSDRDDIRNNRSAHGAVSFVQIGAGKAVLLLWAGAHGT